MEEYTIPTGDQLVMYWNEIIQALPDYFVTDARMALMDEAKRRERLAEVNSALNATAAAYYAAIPPETNPDGVVIWKAPIGSFNAWPTGQVVTHSDQVWTNMSNAPTMEEPGTGSDWVLMEVFDVEKV